MLPGIRCWKYNIVLGVFKDGKMITNWRLETDNNKSADEYGMIINQLFKYEDLDISEVKDVIISNSRSLCAVYAAASVGKVLPQKSDRDRGRNQNRIGRNKDEPTER